MIRDPSDGSVREPELPDIPAIKQEQPRDQQIASGLPAGSTKPEQIERLNKSREWLKEYHAKKGVIE